MSVAAFAVGGRLIAQDTDGAWRRVDQSAQLVAADLGVATTPDALADAPRRRAIARRLATLAVDQIVGAPLDKLGHALELTEPLARTPAPDFVSFSGGVAESLRPNCRSRRYRQLLADEIVAQLKTRPRSDHRAGRTHPGNRHRGLAIHRAGAARRSICPMRRVCQTSVVHLGLDISGDIDPDKVAAAFSKSASLLDLEPNARLALAFAWAGAPEYPRLAAMARAIMRFAAPAGRRDELLVLMIDGDVGRALGRILDKELHLDGKLISVDGAQLRELDFVDIGEPLDLPGVVPVVIKSLLFS